MPKTKQNWGRIAYGADNLVFVWLLTTLPNFKRADNDENCLEQTIKVKSTLSEQWENAEAALCFAFALLLLCFCFAFAFRMGGLP
jgi:hypothetical protein